MSRNLTGHVQQKKSRPNGPVKWRHVPHGSNFNQSTAVVTIKAISGNEGRIAQPLGYERPQVEEFKDARARREAYITSTTFVPHRTHGELLNAPPPGWPMADDECVHGRLAGDPTLPCGCYNER